MSGGGPLDADPECAQLAKLIIKQAKSPNFGLSSSQDRKMKSSSEGRMSWETMLESFSRAKFDFGKWTRRVASEPMASLQQCIQSARTKHPTRDPREFCVVEVFDTCKQIEHSWTKFVFHAVD